MRGRPPGLPATIPRGERHATHRTPLPDRRRRDRPHAAGAAAAPAGRRQRARGNVILAKLEGNNPAGSVKDRAGPRMIRARRGARRDQARRHADRGDLRQHRHRARDGGGDPRLPHGADHAGGPVASSARQTMKAFGAELVLTPQNGRHGSTRATSPSRCSATARAAILDQFANPDNPRIALRDHRPRDLARHRRARSRTSSARWARPARSWACSRFLKEKNPAIQIIGAQPTEGSRIPGIRKWPEAYLPKIYDPHARRPSRVT